MSVQPQESSVDPALDSAVVAAEVDRPNPWRKLRKPFLLCVTFALMLKPLPDLGNDYPYFIVLLSDFANLFANPLLIVSVILLICSCTDFPSVRRVALVSVLFCTIFFGLDFAGDSALFQGMPILSRGELLHEFFKDFFEMASIAALCVSFYLALNEADRTRRRLQIKSHNMALEVLERQKIEGALRDSEERLRLIFEGIQEGIAFYGPDIRPVFFNRAAAEMIGHTVEELLQMHPLDTVHPDDRQRVEDYNSRRWAGLPVERTYELRLLHRDGHVIHTEASFDPIFKDGATIGIQGIYRDITARKRAEEALRESEEHYRQLFEGINDAVCVLDVDCRFVAANERAEHDMGYLNSELMALSFENVCGPIDADLCKQRIEQVLAHGEARWESMLLRKDGSLFPVDVSARRLQYHGKPAIMLISRDITERKRSEEALQALAQGVSAGESGEIYHRLVAHLSKALNMECAYVAIPDESDPGTIRTIAYYLNGRHQEERKFSLQGCPSENVLGKVMYMHCRGVRESFPNAALLHELEAESYVGAPLFSSSGRPLGLIAAIGTKPLENALDAEAMARIFAVRAASELERQRTLEALRMSEERLRTLFEGIDDALFVYDEQGTILDCNAAACRRLGYTRQMLLTLRMRDIDAPWFHEQFPARIAQQMKQGRMACEGEHVAQDGRRIPVDIHTSRISYQGRTAVLSVARDITERKQSEEERRLLEAQMQHAQKLESLGVLAGGIAHEFNNLLMGVLGNASLALMELPSDLPSCESLRQIESAAQRAAELSKQMLAYSGKGRFVIQPIDISAVIEDMAPLLEASVGKKVTFQYDLSRNIPQIEGDLSQVRQVLVNLVSNASESLVDRSGTISISTGVTEATREVLKETYLCENLPEGKYACIEVRDTGCGMDAATLSKIFDPFFSTKFTGRGLGLAAVMGIVRGHKGAIRVRSTKSEGSVFTVLFPCLTQNLEIRPTAAPAAGEWRGSGTVLLVDDEETVRTVTQRVLERAGFSVMCAVDGLDGVEKFKAHAHNLAAVLLDMTMPRMSGEEALREMRRLHAEVPIILSSGYNEPDALERFTSDGPSAFIQKPYRAEELITKVRSVLEDCPFTQT